MNIDTDLISFIKGNLKWITDLIVKYKTTNCLEDNIGESLSGLVFGNAFLDIPPKVKFVIEKLIN